MDMQIETDGHEAASTKEHLANFSDAWVDALAPRHLAKLPKSYGQVDGYSYGAPVRGLTMRYYHGVEMRV